MNKLRSIWDWPKIKKNIKFLLTNDIEKYEYDLTYKIKDEIIEECILEFDEYKKTIKTLNVLNSQDTIDMLKNNPKSFTRFGDGEIHIINGIDQPFQKYDPLLAEKMLKILKKSRNDMYVGLNQSYFQSPKNFAKRNEIFYRVRGTFYRRFFVENCDNNAIYLDASCFGAYFRFDDSFDYNNHYTRIKDLFADKKVALVSGEGVFEKLDYSIFEYASDFKVIHGPRIHAFSEYDNLINKIKHEVTTDWLVCIILGQTATVLVNDLTDLGYLAWDVGHVAKDYDCYMKQVEKTSENIERFWAPD